MAWQRAQRQAGPEHRKRQDAQLQVRQVAERQRAAGELGLKMALQPGRPRVEMEQRPPPLAQKEERAETMGVQEHPAQQSKPRAQEPAAQRVAPAALRA
jgi:hypothetical protein